MKWKNNLYFDKFLYIRLPTLHVPLTSHVATAAARTIRVSMEEPALRSVSPQMFGTTVPVLYRLLVNTARFSWEEAVRIIKQPVSPPLDCTPLLMTETKLSKYKEITRMRKLSSLKNEMPSFWIFFLRKLSSSLLLEAFFTNDVFE